MITWLKNKHVYRYQVKFNIECYIRYCCFFRTFIYNLAKTLYFCNTIMKLRAVIERITYQNGENGYSILKARVKGDDDLVTLVGNMLDVTVGTVLVADGQWKVNRQYGCQFVVENIIEHDSKRLAEVDGIGLKRIRKIRDSWMKQLDIKDV